MSGADIVPVASPPDVVSQLFGPSAVIDGDDPFAGIGQEEETGHSEVQEPAKADDINGLDGSQSVSLANDDEPDFSELIESSNGTSPEPISPQRAVLHEKDYSDLLAEFEDEGGTMSPVAGHPSTSVLEYASHGQSNEGEDSRISGSHETMAGSSLGAAALLGDDDGPSIFDDLAIQNDEPTTPVDSRIYDRLPQDLEDGSPVPTLPIEHSADVSMQSLFEADGEGDLTSTSGWLDDTDVEESFQFDNATDSLFLDSNKAPALQFDAVEEELPFDVPEGWYDEAGEFQWYTPEQKEAVRQTMLGERSWDMGDVESPMEAQPIQDRIPTAPYSPALEAAQSENAARRTPVSEQRATMPDSFPFDAYAPPATYTGQSNLSPYGAPSQATSSYSANAYIPAPSPFAASGTGYTAASGYAAAAGFDPYSPGSRSFSSRTQTLLPPISSSSQAPIAAPKPPAKPQRVISNAYDPPLRPQKSFVRSTTAAPVIPFTPPPLPSTTPIQSAPIAPPPGPPKRNFSQAPSMSMAPPPGPPPRQTIDEQRPPSFNADHQPQDSLSHLQHPQDQSIGMMNPPSRPASVSTSRLQTAPSYGSFDPPLRPSSAARSISRNSARPAFSPPPQIPASTPTLSPRMDEIPIPSSTRTVPPRRASPMFEVKPRSRPPSALQAKGRILEPTSRIMTPLPVPSPNPMVSQREEHDWRSRPDSEVAPAPQIPVMEYGREANSLQLEGADDYDPPPPREEIDPYAPSAYASTSYQPSTYDSGPSAPFPHQPMVPSQHTSSTAPDTYMQIPTASPPPPPRATYDAYAPLQPIANRPRQVSQPPIPDQQLHAYQPAAWAPPPIPSLVQPEEITPRVTSPEYGSSFGQSPTFDYFQTHSSAKDHTYVPQQVLEQRPINEDPLGRCTLAARNIPLAVFGFGGLLITAFPANAEDVNALTHNRTPSYGYASGRGQLWIRKITDAISSSALKANEAVFPGPLISDASAAKGVAAEKKKKESVLAYLNTRAEEIEKGLPYLQSSAKAARREEEGKLVVLRLLTAMVTGDGKLSGSPQIEDSVRQALTSVTSQTPIATTGNLPTVLSNSLNAPKASAAASSQHLAQLSSFLVQGNKEAAVEFSAEHGLWSHALLIASCVNQDLWTDIVMKFIQAELGSASKVAALKASYSIFSGKTADNVDDLVAAANITNDPSHDQWKEVLSAVVFNGNAAQLKCLDELGNRFMAAGLANAAHACYILSPSSPFGDVTLSAFEKVVMLVQNYKDEDSIIFAEIAEYARTLITIPKGQELPYPGLPALLPYKLQRAWLAAELGEVDRAQRYCNAVEAATKIKNAPSLLPSYLVASLEDLVERLTGEPSATPSKGFGSRKSNGKAGLSSWIEGRLTKFIAGEDEGATSAPKPPPSSSKDPAAPVGPFSHFSSISPVPSTTDVPSINGHSTGLGGSRITSPFAHTSPYPGSSVVNTPAADYNSGSYGDYMSHGNQGGYEPPTGEAEDEDMTPGARGADDGDFINPMANLSLGPSAPINDHQPRSSAAADDVNEDEDDLGFGNRALSRNRTPKPESAPDQAKAADTKADSKGAASDNAAHTSPSKAEPAKSSGWLGRWWGKKEGEPAGPIKAKLGEESSMVFDKDLKRWVVKGAKGETSLPTAPPPPPRAQTVSPGKAMRSDPANRASTATPPASQLSRSTGPPSAPATVSISRVAPPPSMSPADPDAYNGPARPKSSLTESISATDIAGAGAPPGRPPTGPPPPTGGGPPSRPPPSKAPTAASLDDLLSRPPSKRPASAAARKGARNRYVDVFQPGGE